MDNLMRVLEREPDPEGHLYRRTKRRMNKLETELKTVEAVLRQHIAAAPPERDDNVELLTRLPQVELDLNLLAADRLRRFLEAFRVEIHYDCNTGRANLRAEISANLLDQLIRRAEATAAITSPTSPNKNKNGPSEPGRPEMINGGSFGECASWSCFRTIYL